MFAIQTQSISYIVCINWRTPIFFTIYSLLCMKIQIIAFRICYSTNLFSYNSTCIDFAFGCVGSDNLQATYIKIKKNNFIGQKQLQILPCLVWLETCTVLRSHERHFGLFVNFCFADINSSSVS